MGAGTCDLTMAGAASVTAVFTALGGPGQAPAGVVDPTAFGARCDGAADDAPALLAATQAAAKAGEAMLVPCKLRLASGAIAIDATTQFVGAGGFDLQPGASLALHGPLLGSWSRIFFLNGGSLLVQVPNARVYPQWWGAKGDGVADDAPAIQAAIDAASRAAIDDFEWNQGVGGTVSLPRGVYRIASPLVVRGDAVRIEGHGAHTTALRADMDPTSDVLTVGDGTGAGRNVFLTDFSVYALGEGKFRDGVVVHGATWPTLQNMTVSYAGRYAFRVRGTLHARLSHLRARHAGTGLWIGATAAGVEATTVHVEQFATTSSTGPGVIVEKAFGVLFDQLTSESCGSIASPATSQGIVIGTATTGATTEVTLLHPYFEGNHGWDVEIGLDPLHAASATIVGGSYRATWTKQPGYGAIRVDRVRSGGVIGGYATGYDPPLETIRLTQNGWNFSVLGLDLPGTNPPQVTGSTLDQYRGRITTFDGGGDVWDRGRVVSRAGGPGAGAGIALSGGGGPPADCRPPWTVGSIVELEPREGAPHRLGLHLGGSARHLDAASRSWTSYPVPSRRTATPTRALSISAAISVGRSSRACCDAHRNSSEPPPGRSPRRPCRVRAPRRRGPGPSASSRRARLAPMDGAAPSITASSSSMLRAPSSRLAVSRTARRRAAYRRRSRASRSRTPGPR